MTPEICTHCGQPIGMAEELERTKQFENHESHRRQALYSALVRIATSITIFDAIKIAETAIRRDRPICQHNEPASPTPQPIFEMDGYGAQRFVGYTEDKR